MTRASMSPVYQPSDAELRMLGAILFQSVREAWRCGEDHVQFLGYCIAARRIDAADGSHPQMVLTLRVAGAAGVVGVSAVLDRVFIAVAPHPISGTRCDIRLKCVRPLSPRRTESPVGCVSPTDARYASPETGHVS